MVELIWSNKHHTEPSQPYSCITTEEYISTSQKSTPIPWHNRLIWGEKNAVLSTLLTDFAESIHLIYIDPPFMTGRTFTCDSGIAYHDTWHNDLNCYIQWLYETFSLLYRLLHPNGCLYVHLDWRTTHYARVILDEIFCTHQHGAGFQNEIIWHYQSGGRAKHHFARKHDTILLYSKASHFCFHPERIGERRGNHRRNHMRKEVTSDGRISWTIRSAGRTYTYGEDTLLTPSDVWHDINHLHQRDPERAGYATQKPQALLERIILASSEVHDIVLDCFCGSGVTAVVAEQLGRRWLASDQSELAIMTTRSRLLANEHTHPFRIQKILPVR